MAGYSERMGRWKPEIILDGAPILRHVAELALRHVSRLIVVTGYRGAQARELLPRDRRLQVTENPDYSRGMFSSIQTALPELSAESFLVFLGDMPGIPDSVVQQLVEAPVEPWIRPVYRGKPGHPVRIHRTLIDELLNLDPREGEMRDVLRRHPGRLLEVEHPGVHRDLDTPEDLRRFMADRRQDIGDG